MARLAMSHARVDRRAPVTSRVVSRVYRSGLLWATIVGLLVTLVMTVIVRPRVPSAFSGLAGTVVAVAFFGVRPWRSSAQPERLLASGRWALRHPS